MWRRLGYFPNLWSPKTFNEKVVHRRLFDFNPIYSELADKWRVRTYVTERVGSTYVNSVYQVVDSPTDIVLNDLPETFVIKATHDSGSTRIIENVNDVNWEELFCFYQERLTQLPPGASHWYKDIPPRLVVEERITDRSYRVPIDYKFYVFHGVVRFVDVIVGHGDMFARRFYDSMWTPLSIRHPIDGLASVMDRPKQFDAMVWVAEALAEGMDFVRVDLYAPNDERVIFGELTFAPYQGKRRFIPISFDRDLGRYW